MPAADLYKRANQRTTVRRQPVEVKGQEEKGGEPEVAVPPPVPLDVSVEGAPLPPQPPQGEDEVLPERELNFRPSLQWRGQELQNLPEDKACSAEIPYSGELHSRKRYDSLRGSVRNYSWMHLCILLSARLLFMTSFESAAGHGTLPSRGYMPVELATGRRPTDHSDLELMKPDQLPAVDLLQELKKLALRAHLEARHLAECSHCDRGDRQGSVVVRVNQSKVRRDYDPWRDVPLPRNLDKPEKDVPLEPEDGDDQLEEAAQAQQDLSANARQCSGERVFSGDRSGLALCLASMMAFCEPQ